MLGVSMEGGNPVGAWSRIVAILVGGIVACGAAFVLLGVLSLLRPPWIGAVVPAPRGHALADLAATLGAAVAGGFAMSRFGRGGMGQAVALGVVLLVAFLGYGVNFLNPSWQIGAVILLLLPAVGLGVSLGRTRPSDPAPPLGRGIGVVGRIAGGVVAMVGAHRLLNRLSIGFSSLDVIEVVALAGLAWLLIRSAAAAPRWRGAAGALAALSLFAIPVGCLVLLLRLIAGVSVVTASAVSPDGRMVVQLADRGTFMFDRNFDVRLRRYGLWRHVWTSPDESLPHGERFLWSRDGRHVLLLGAKLFATVDSCLASGEFMYLHLDTQTGEVRANTPQRRGPRFALADLAGIEFAEPLVPGVGSMPRFGGPVCEAPESRPRVP